MTLLPGSFVAFLFVSALLLAVFGVVSAIERERRASALALAAAVSALLLGLGVASLPLGPRVLVGAAGWVVAVVLGLYLFIPRPRNVFLNGRPARRVDERGIMFARARLEPGTDRFEDYYTEHPEHRESDDRFRRLPGLLSPRAQLAETGEFKAAEALFAKTEAMREAVDGPVAGTKNEMTPQKAARELKQRALAAGACDAGVTPLQEYHVYSHIGRGTGVWGEPVAFDGGWALAFTVEMDHRVMQSAPAAPVVAESARRYVQAAEIAIDLADLIRSWGFAARAHIDGNYRVIAPLVAADAGLGEIGRMGILMTPRLGPRVRLGVVTTSLPLHPDSPGDDRAMLDFCTTCRKCADNCPPRAIPFGDRKPVDEGLRWQIDADACFRYWSTVGTDCGRCMAVCPFSHPDNAAHNLVRKLIQDSPGARKPMLWMDDLFYGRKPASRT